MPRKIDEVGSRARVMHGSARCTPDGLCRDDLMYNAKGRIIRKRGVRGGGGRGDLQRKQNEFAKKIYDIGDDYAKFAPHTPSGYKVRDDLEALERQALHKVFTKFGELKAVQDKVDSGRTIVGKLMGYPDAGSARIDDLVAEFTRYCDTVVEEFRANCNLFSPPPDWDKRAR